ncbi:MAG: hypothetical protein ACO1RT_17440 [Planctomycetaceae bacterium]
MIAETTPENAAQIRQRMQQIRLSLPAHLVEVKQEVRRDVRTLTDWKFYVRQYPAVVLPVVALATYTLVPKKAPPVVEATNRTLADMMPFVSRKKEQEVAKKSWLAGVASVVAGLALKSATSYATGRASSILRDLVTHGPPPAGPRSTHRSAPY